MYTKENIKELKEKMIKSKIGVAYLLLDKNNELMITTNHMYGKGSGVYLRSNPNGLVRTLYGDKESYILTLREVDKFIEN